MRASALLLVTLVSLSARPAAAFVCQRAVDGSGGEGGSSLSWFTRNLSYTFFSAGTADIPSYDELDAMRASFAAWMGLQACSSSTTTDLTFAESSLMSTTDRIGYNFVNPEDNENLIIFRDAGWPHPGQAALIIALTTTTYTPLTGEIFDADIEFNTAEFDFTADAEADGGCTIVGDGNCTDRSAGTCRMDLMNVAVHEIGHFLGLGHEDQVTCATMNSSGQPGEIAKRTLACDERNAIAFKYPSLADNGYCPATGCSNCAPPEELDRHPNVDITDSDDGMGGCGCGASAGALPLVALVAWLRARRRRPQVFSSSLS